MLRLAVAGAAGAAVLLLALPAAATAPPVGPLLIVTVAPAHR